MTEPKMDLTKEQSPPRYLVDKFRKDDKIDGRRKTSFEEYHNGQFGALKETDAEVYGLIKKEYQRLQNNIELLAAENQCSPAVLAALGSVVQNKTAEGFPGARFHGGCEVIDDVERLAIDRAKEAFGTRYANVQPHSGTGANHIVITAVLEAGDKILGLSSEQGGHYSHGDAVSLTGRFFDVENYYLDKKTFLLDYDAIRDKAVKVKPKLIICGASAYVRTIDFKKFRAIADEVGAYLLADISHISGLVMAGAHPSPVEYAHFITTSTYKPGGPRGGLILMGKEYDKNIKIQGKDMPLWKRIEDTTFPGVQGTPYLNHIAAKAVFFKEMLSDEYRNRQFKIIENAKKLAAVLADLGLDVLTKGTDNHMVLINAGNSRQGLTGVTAQKCLEECGITVDKMRLPYDEKAPAITSGIRLGTPIVTRNGMGTEQMQSIARLIDAVLKRVEIISETEYRINSSFREQVKAEVAGLCDSFAMR
ncbi:MAG: serine hydroxymethyltransferase [Phycisphaerae bacterium]|nr:serine hydroxymethyltransferase [Phycisphaerae bacterium]